ncbi:glycosyltransferase family 9 protein [Segetibacter aerophilus]|uniref:Glycosyl transferase family 9 n=1 Tax=Segetibacter aerophilus TaxID=670293 RepID=A0A512B7R4_9BACT|nr:glycosyltransferase family 9 protein [Segetibacter aerophilus]GEO08001.1 glycosyl transferase family 9 [Segetibacter aerophilus]
MLQSEDKLKNVQKIAVLRANALGDFIVTLPALKALRTTYPNAEIVLLGKSWHQQFLAKGRSPIDRVVVVPVKKGIRNEAGEAEDLNEIDAFLAQMRNEHFDVVLNFQGNGISANPFIKQFGARLTVGLTCEKAEKLDRSIDYYYYQSEVIRFLEVVKLVGAETPSLEPELQVLATDRDEVKSFLSTLQNQPFIVLHPVAMDTRRMWPLENYGGLADALRQRNLEVVFTGAAEDRQVIDDIIDTMNYTAVNACGNFSLGGLSALLSQAAVMIAADTGPLHLARAVNTPTIGFYWAPNLINWGPLTRTIHRPLISWKMECPICGIVPNDPYPFEPQTESCDHPVSFTRDISIEQVLKAVDGLLPQENSIDKSTNIRTVEMNAISS